MKYILLVYIDETAWTENEREQCFKESVHLTQELNANGQYLGASPLQSVAKATSVRMRDGKRMVTDGPFAETREQLGGYFLIDATNLEEAIAIAERIPSVHKGTVEIRPILELSDLPSDK
ncbi:YciI family protein [Pseudanabaena sp. UWO310]|uniref:YciI family protein n=1 Tax=Pseudanabaena sp. UWO310 TaxID=2480795 RepID=UPI00115BAF1D|nr:YciI family protein [Pseudanabaena sp. UWO310]TYQ31320.1 YciI family protein [Pseudanabaena sp. UWO310]